MGGLNCSHLSCVSGTIGCYQINWIHDYRCDDVTITGVGPRLNIARPAIKIISKGSKHEHRDSSFLETPVRGDI